MELVDLELVRGPLDGELLTIPAEPSNPPEVIWTPDGGNYLRGVACTCTGVLRWFYLHEESIPPTHRM